MAHLFLNFVKTDTKNKNKIQATKDMENFDEPIVAYYVRGEESRNKHASLPGQKIRGTILIALVE